MQKVEDLFNVAVGTFDTPKKLNRCSKPVRAEVIRDLEAGKFSNEMLNALISEHPVFRYKTCVTIHGNWPEIERERIGSYKNVIQNANGSIEVRYSAIDADKRKAIADLILPSNFRYSETSAGGYFAAHKVVNADNFAQVLAEFRETVARIESIDFYGSACIYRAANWGINYLVCHIAALAIPVNSVEPFAVAIAGQSIDMLRAAAETRRREREAEEARYKAEHEADKIRWAAEKKQQQEHARELRAAIVAMPLSAAIEKGILIEVVKGKTPTTSIYKYYRYDGKGTFGRVKHSVAYSAELSLQDLNWKEQKQMKSNEIGDLLSTRQFTPTLITRPEAVAQAPAKVQPFIPQQPRPAAQILTLF